MSTPEFSVPAAGVLISDGGLATELEARGHDLSDDLWSARLLAEAPAEIVAVHEAFYRAGARATGIGDCDFYYITVEKQPPNLVSVTRLHPDAVTLGDTLMRQAVRTYAACLETDTWPGYGDDITEIDLPAWAYYSNNTDDVEIVIP